MYRRLEGLFYVFDQITRKRESLQTTDKAVTSRLLDTKNEVQEQPTINRQIAHVFLAVGHPGTLWTPWQLLPKVNQDAWGHYLDEADRV